MQSTDINVNNPCTDELTQSRSLNHTCCNYTKQSENTMPSSWIHHQAVTRKGEKAIHNFFFATVSKPAHNPNQYHSIQPGDHHRSGLSTTERSSYQCLFFKRRIVGRYTSYSTLSLEPWKPKKLLLACAAISPMISCPWDCQESTPSLAKEPHLWQPSG